MGSYASESSRDENACWSQMFSMLCFFPKQLNRNHFDVRAKPHSCKECVQSSRAVEIPQLWINPLRQTERTVGSEGSALRFLRLYHLINAKCPLTQRHFTQSELRDQLLTMWLSWRIWDIMNFQVFNEFSRLADFWRFDRP